MALSINKRITNWLGNTNGFLFVLYAAGFSFCLYTCIYSFRKAFSVASFDSELVFGISYKVWLIISQVLGYALSKFIGISFVSELEKGNRARYVIVFSLIAVLSWLFFAITPAPFNIPFLFINGLHLGMMWGILFSYLEGRRCTEALAAGLSVSFIFSSGFVKTVGAFTMYQWGTDEYWMPFVTSLIFLGPLFACTWLMEQIPPPSVKDVAARSRRQPMLLSDRRVFVRSFWPGIVLFIVAYFMLTAFRDFRDNFAAELWQQLGHGDSASIFTLTEIPIAVVVLLAIGLMMYIRNNQVAFALSHFLVILGFSCIGVSTWFFESGLLSATPWMILVGLGLYLGYVPFNSVFFERMLASFRYAGTVGFIMYLSDSIGYLGSISTLLLKELGFSGLSWLQFFVQSGYVISVAGMICMISSLVYFTIRQKTWKHTDNPHVGVPLTTAPELQR